MSKAGVGTCLPLLFLFAAGASGQPEEPFRPKGTYNNSVHQFHPDLEARLNVVRFERWRTLEIGWESGLTERDREISAYALLLARNPPRFPPEADRVAPLLARDAAPIFRALRWGQALEQQLLDVLASPDAGERLSAARLDRALLLYRRERWALSEPAEPVPGGPSLETTAAWRVAMAGARLFTRAAADLTTPDYAQQRWLVKQTIADFDRASEGDRPAEQATYAASAPAAAAAFPGVTKALDRVEQLRRDVLEALAPGGAAPEARQKRAERLRGVARRYGLPASGIGAARWP
jgi:hypothetical protein